MYRTYSETDGDFSGTVILISVEGVILQLWLLYLVPFRHFVKFRYSCYLLFFGPTKTRFGIASSTQVVLTKHSSFIDVIQKWLRSERGKNTKM